MSEHKTGRSSWADEQKQLYRERRQRGLNGVARAVTAFQPVIDEEGKPQRVELGNKTGRQLSTGKQNSFRAHRRHPEAGVPRQLRHGSARSV